MAELIVKKLVATEIAAGQFLVEYDLTVKDYTFNKIYIQASVNEQRDYYSSYVIYDGSSAYHDEINIVGGGAAENFIVVSNLANPIVRIRVINTSPLGYFDSQEYVFPINITNTPKISFMKQKNFFQSAVSAVLRFGKENGLVQWVDGKLQAFLADGATRANIAVADAVADEDAVTLKQVRTQIAEMAKKGGMIVTDLVASANPWSENEIRVTTDLEFQRYVDGAAEAFVPADGTVISVAKELVINGGYVYGDEEDGGENILKADHIYIYDFAANMLYDNGAIANSNWMQNGALLSPADSTVKEIHLENSEQGLSLLQIRNDNDVDNYTGSVIELKGSGDDFTNNLFVGKYGENYWLPALQDRGAVMTDKKLVIASAGGDDSAVEFYVGGDYNDPSKVAEMTTGTGLVYEEDLSASFVDNSAVSKKYVDSLGKNSSHKLPVTIDSAGAATGLEAIPADAHVVGTEVIVNEVFDGTVNGLKLQFAGADLIDFAAIDLDEVAKMPIPTYAQEAADTTPVVTGSIDDGATGSMVVLIEYVTA